MKSSRLRAIPSVDRVLRSIGDAGLPRPLVVDLVRREIGAVRREAAIPDADAILARVRSRLADLSASRIQPVVNGTGILVHTNFGRAPLGPRVVAALSQVGSNYNNLEYDLVEGARGGRAAYLERALAVLCGADNATVVNNNAAALVLILRHFCRDGRRDVIISRGELVQIGGGFRIPEVLESSGARLREVGTTNQTTLADYARAVTRETALILKVHRSNFFMEGFVQSPSADEIASLARRKRVPFVEDLGSGSVIETAAVAGLEHEPTPAEVLRRGVDLVCFSGDKLLGGPQAGVIAGRARLIAALKREPFYRALRCDKLILAALEAVVDIYLDDLRPGAVSVPHAGSGLPVIDMLHGDLEDLRRRAARMAVALDGLPLVVRVGAGRAQIGGGTLPRSGLASVTLDLSHPALKPQELARRLRRQPLPVVGYVARDTVKLDLRTIFPRQDDDVISAVRAAAAR